jgi:23S rRNA (guanosine2251-2'-O)-methyltransferase
MDEQICLVLDNVRSALNVGSILRTADGLGVETVYLCGYTPYPKVANDDRLPHLSQKIHNRIAKTALGAESTQAFVYRQNTEDVILDLKQRGYKVIGLEQREFSLPLQDIKLSQSRIALVVGNEIEGVRDHILKICDLVAQIDMAGQKESFNVSAAAAMALFYFRYML